VLLQEHTKNVRIDPPFSFFLRSKYRTASFGNVVYLSSTVSYIIRFMNIVSDLGVPRLEKRLSKNDSCRTTKLTNFERIFSVFRSSPTVVTNIIANIVTRDVD
jgi:hypothetical protein